MAEGWEESLVHEPWYEDYEKENYWGKNFVVQQESQNQDLDQGLENQIKTE